MVLLLIYQNREDWLLQSLEAGKKYLKYFHLNVFIRLYKNLVIKLNSAHSSNILVFFLCGNYVKKVLCATIILPNPPLLWTLICSLGGGLSREKASFHFKHRSGVLHWRLEACCYCLSLPCCNRQPQSQKVSSPLASPNSVEVKQEIPKKSWWGIYFFQTHLKHYYGSEGELLSTQLIKSCTIPNGITINVVCFQALGKQPCEAQASWCCRG